jgi:hypothetical protein
MRNGNEIKKTDMQSMQPHMDTTERTIAKDLPKSKMLQPILEQRTTKIKTNCHYCNKAIMVKPVCIKDHAKTNFNRWYWFALLRDYWIYEYEGFELFIMEKMT